MKKLLSLFAILLLVSCSTTRQHCAMPIDYSSLTPMPDQHQPVQSLLGKTSTGLKEGEIANVVVRVVVDKLFYKHFGNDRQRLQTALDTYFRISNEVFAPVGIKQIPLIDESLIGIEFKPVNSVNGTLSAQLRNMMIAKGNRSDHDRTIAFSGTGGYANAGCYGCVGYEYTGTAEQTHLIKDKDKTILTYQGQDYEYWCYAWGGHEDGHTYGANHTAAYLNEGVGYTNQVFSGTCIMGDAGLAGSFNIQNRSYKEFGWGPMYQMTTFLKSPLTKFILHPTVTDNKNPVIEFIPSITIPNNTPFIIYNNVTDPNKGDKVKRSTEQATPTDGRTIPVPADKNVARFNKYEAHYNNWQSFPTWTDVYDGIKRKYDVLPKPVGKTNEMGQMRIDFYTHAYDGKGGWTISNKHSVNVSNLIGSVEVTSQSVQDNWTVGSNQTITWSVNGSNSGVVNAKSVQIYLADRSGERFLVGSGPNNGVFNLIVPVRTGKYKVMVIGNNNFYSLSKGEIAIATASNAPTNLKATVSGSSVTLTWDAPTNFTAVKYSVYMDRDCDNETPYAAGQNCEGYKGETTTRSFTVRNVPKGLRKFDVKGKAVDGLRTVKSEVVTVNIQ